MPVASQYEAGEFMEQIHVDPKTGQRYDERGNPISYGGAKSVGWNDPCFYTATGQALTYYAVYGAPFGLSPKVKYADAYPGPANVHQNVPLTDFATAYEIDSGLFIGPKLAPIHTVQKRSDTFYKLNQSQAEDMLRDEDDYSIRAVGGVANDIQQQFDTDTYQVVDHAFRDFLPDETADNADEVLQLQEQITTFLTTVLQLHYDYRLIDDILVASNFSSQDFGTAVASDSAKHIDDTSATNRYIHTGFNVGKTNVIQANAMKGPNTVVMGAQTALDIAKSTEISEVVKHTMGESYVVQGGWQGPNYGLPSQLYGLEVVVVPHVENTAAKLATPSFSYKLSDKFIFLGIEAPGRRTRNVVTTFRKGGLNIRTYRDEARKGTFIEAEMIQDEKITNSNGGYILSDVSA